MIHGLWAIDVFARRCRGNRKLVFFTSVKACFMCRCAFAPCVFPSTADQRCPRKPRGVACHKKVRASSPHSPWKPQLARHNCREETAGDNWQPHFNKFCPSAPFPLS